MSHREKTPVLYTGFYPIVHMNGAGFGNRQMNSPTPSGRTELCIIRLFPQLILHCSSLITYRAITLANFESIVLSVDSLRFFLNSFSIVMETGAPDSQRIFFVLSERVSFTRHPSLARKWHTLPNDSLRFPPIQKQTGDKVLYLPSHIK